MAQHASFVTLALALALPVVGCGNTTAEPIGSGGSSSASSTATTASSTGTGGEAASSTSSTSGTGAGPGACAPACGSGEVCVEASCHALAKLDSASAGNGACNIALDATTAYWVSGEVRMVPKAGGQATSLPAWLASNALAIDDTYVYFNTGSAISRAAKSGASGFSPFTSSDVGSVKHLAADGTTLYYLDPAPTSTAAGVFETPLAGPAGTMPTLFATNLYGVGTVAVDATSVYYWGGQGLVKEDKTTQAVTDLFSDGSGFGNIGDATGLVVDGADVYYSTVPIQGEGAVIVRVSSAGGAPSVVVDSTQGLTGVFTVDATSVYYMTFSGVMKVSKTGGYPVLVSALALPSPFATCMAVDDAYLYWVDGADLMQYAK